MDEVKLATSICFFASCNQQLHEAWFHPKRFGLHRVLEVRSGTQDVWQGHTSRLVRSCVCFLDIGATWQTGFGGTVVGLTTAYDCVPVVAAKGRRKEIAQKDSS